MAKHTCSKRLARRIENEISNWDNPNSKARKRFEAARLQGEALLLPIRRAIADSVRIGPSDLSIIINAR